MVHVGRPPLVGEGGPKGRMGGSVNRGPASTKAAARCNFTVGRIANPSHDHSILRIFPSAGRLATQHSPLTTDN